MGATASHIQTSNFKRSVSYRQSRSGKLKSERGEKNGGMDRLRRSFRDSFRRRKDQYMSDRSKPHQWQSDEASVRAGTCFFHVKYLGCVEVYESRGLQVCEDALKVLRNSRRRAVRAILHVSGDGLQIVDDETKGLMVDQTIEKVSFCAPDRNHEKGFSYICRDGSTRRWMCHGFLALKESGERLSHAVGCAFAACLERKQKRDKECAVTMNFDPSNSTFTRSGSFRQPTLTDRIIDGELPHLSVPPPSLSVPTAPSNVKPTNAHAIERPHAPLPLLQRQGSFRGFTQLNQSSPFKRQLSLRIGDLPSNLERTRLQQLTMQNIPTQPHLKTPVSPIPESISPLKSDEDPVSVMCQELSLGLSLLSKVDDQNPALLSEASLNLERPISAPPPIAGSPAFLAKLDALKFDSSSTILPPVSSADSNPTRPQGPTHAVHVSQQVAELPRPEQWLDTLTSKVSHTPLSHVRAQSLSAAEPFLHKTDPFDSNWTAQNAILEGQPHALTHENKNPFLSSSNHSSLGVKPFQIQL